MNKFCAARNKLFSIEMYIREIEVKNIAVKTNLPVGDYAVNPYVGCEHGCKYCYACFMKRFTGHEEPWGSFADVKFWRETAHPEKFAGKELFFGSVTDPYQPLEEKYGRTRALLKQLQGSGAKISIATKSDLVLRDLELIKTFPDSRVSFSVNTLDENFKDDMDRAPSIARRFAAMKKLHDAGVRTTCFISPIFPGITSCREIIARAKDICNLVWLENLNLRGNFKAQIMRYIAEKYPSLLPLYREIYDRRNRGYWLDLDEEMGEFCRKEGLEYVRNTDDLHRPFTAPPVVVNYFFHEEIKRSSTPKQRKNGGRGGILPS